MTNGRLVILSDMHLGRRWAAARSAEALRPLWEGADQLVLNGDIAEIHHLAHRETANRELDHLLRLCERDDVSVRMLTGNHDAFLTRSRHLLLNGGEVFVTHGDVLHPAIAPWSRWAERMRQTYWRVLGEARGSRQEGRAKPAGDSGELERHLRAAEHAGYEEWADRAAHSPTGSLWELLARPWEAAMILSYWWRFPGYAAEFAERHVPRARYIVLGHSHRQGIWTVGDRVIINTGCYGFPGRPRAVVLEEGVLSVQPIQRKGGVYHLVDRPIAQYELRGEESSGPASRLNPSSTRRLSA
jgi:predicted phosphodiesterase